MKTNEAKSLEALKRLEEDDVIHDDLVIETTDNENNEIEYCINWEDIKICRYLEGNMNFSDSMLLDTTLAIWILWLKEDTIRILKNKPLLINDERYYCMLAYWWDDTEEKGFLMYLSEISIWVLFTRFH